MTAEEENKKFVLNLSETIAVDPMDYHAEHIQQHKEILSNPEYRTNPIIVENIINHIQSHIDALIELEGKL